MMLEHAHLYLTRCDLDYSWGVVATLEANADAIGIILAAMDAVGVL